MSLHLGFSSLKDEESQIAERHFEVFMFVIQEGYYCSIQNVNAIIGKYCATNTGLLRISNQDLLGNKVIDSSLKCKTYFKSAAHLLKLSNYLCKSWVLKPLPLSYDSKRTWLQYSTIKLDRVLRTICYSNIISTNLWIYFWHGLPGTRIITVVKT